jgi:phage baseplate assembly protein W
MTTLSYTLPALPAGGTGLGNQAFAGQVDRLFGRDLWFDVTDRVTGGDLVVTKAGDWAIAEGREALRQWIIRFLITNPGEWQTLPNYGSGARLFLKAKNTIAARDEIASRIRGGLRRNPRIKSVDEINVRFISGGIQMSVVVTPQGETQRNKPVRAAVEVF